MAFSISSAVNGTLESFLTQYQPGDVEWVSITGSTPLLEALKNSDRQNRSDIANFLLDEGADATIQMPSGYNALHVLLGRADYRNPETDLNLLVRLLDSGADINAVDKKSGTPLQCLDELTLNIGEELVVPFYDVFFSRDDLDLFKKGSFGKSTYDMVREDQEFRPLRFERVEEYLREREVQSSNPEGELSS